MATREAKQGAGLESGVTKKEKIGDYSPREQNAKNGKPKSPATEKVGEFKIK